jgi:hypothetical protein
MPDDFMGVAESNLVNVIRYGNIQVEFSPGFVAADQYFSNRDNNTATFPTLLNATHCFRTTDEGTVDANSRRMTRGIGRYLKIADASSRDMTPDFKYRQPNGYYEKCKKKKRILSSL